MPVRTQIRERIKELIKEIIPCVTLNDFDASQVLPRARIYPLSSQLERSSMSSHLDTYSVVIDVEAKDEIGKPIANTLEGYEESIVAKLRESDSTLDEMLLIYEPASAEYSFDSSGGAELGNVAITVECQLR